MKTTLMIAAAAVMTLQARQIESAEEKTVIVYFENCLAPKEEFLAKKLTNQMLASAGVRILWRAGVPSLLEHSKEQPIVVQFETNAPASEHPGALAFSQPYEGTHIKVFYDRIHTPDARTTYIVLAHVLVHEITHILQGIERHSRSGVMKACWSPTDFRAMLWRPLAFEPKDIDLIQSGLATRQALLAEVVHKRE